jgi:peptidyl-dipeptidase Dcp
MTSTTEGRALHTGAANPLLDTWTAPFGLPPFDRIRPHHFAPAFDSALSEHRTEVAAIAANPSPPTFANTVEALERAGRTLERVSLVLSTLARAHTNDKIERVEREVAPRLARHRMDILQNDALFRRVDSLMAAPERLDLAPEQQRVLKLYHRRFVRAGARLDQGGKARLTAIAERLAALATQFGQNVLADEQAFALVLDGEADLAGLPPSLRADAAQTAEERGIGGKHAITLSRSSIEPFLQYSARRDLREQACKAWMARGANGGATDNRRILAEIVALRAEAAHLLGFENAAAMALELSMAKTPEAVRKLLMDVWGPARARSLAERDALQRAARSDGSNCALAPWDWRYYAEKVRRARFGFDEAEIKPYLQLENILAAAFFVADKLFGVRFRELSDLRLYHRDVRAFEVTRKDGRHVGLFLADYFARPSKHSGAWMSSLRRQQKLAGDIRPIVVNVANFAKAPRGQPSLLSLEDARTLFHEFGHALHGLLSDVVYPCVSGTAVLRDFVELPSQLFEHWLTCPEVLVRFARHAETGAPIPAELVEKLKNDQTSNQGFRTAEYLASAFADLELHVLPSASALDIDRFEAETLARIGMPEEIGMRHRLPHFQHIVGDYAAGYYAYLWSEVMDADAFAAFQETGDVFHAETARRLHDCIYSAGGRQEPEEAYIAFRGRLPTVDALLKKRGLTESGRRRQGNALSEVSEA